MIILAEGTKWTLVQEEGSRVLILETEHGEVAIRTYEDKEKIFELLLRFFTWLEKSNT